MLGSCFTKLKNASKRLNIIFGITAIMILVVATILTFSQHQWAVNINQWQMELMGDNTYFPVLTISILALPILLVLMPIKIWLIQLELKRTK